MGYNFPVAIRCYLFQDSVGDIVRWFEEHPEGCIQVCSLALPPYTNATLGPPEMDQTANYWSETYLSRLERNGFVRRID